MLALPVSRYALSAAKFCVLLCYLFMEMAVFFAVFVVAGLIEVSGAGITETLPIIYLLKWCSGLFCTMLPSVAVMWAITVIFDKPLLSVGLNLLLVIPGVLAANTPLWIIYPYCYSGYLVSCSLHDVTSADISNGFQLFPFLPCAIGIFAFVFWIAITRFGKKEMSWERMISISDVRWLPLRSRDDGGFLDYGHGIPGWCRVKSKISEKVKFWLTHRNRYYIITQCGHVCLCAHF